MTVQGAYAFRITGPQKPLQLVELPALTPKDDEVVVEVAGCGICHTDVGFAYDGVPTRKPFPLVLGHEITGRVVAVGEKAAWWLGKRVIVPAVIACGACAACRAGRPTICRKQFMPGNDGDGGFASHVLVPSRGLCEVPEPLPAGIQPELLSVVADAVTTPWEAIRRSGLKHGDTAVFVGAGGVGGFGVQIASALGAHVMAIDVDERRLQLASHHGAHATFNAKLLGEKELKAAVRTAMKVLGASSMDLKIFETSGTPAGQQTAFNLLDFGAHLGIVGYTPTKVELRLSNLMAFDAKAEGNWGCPADQYPPALELVLLGKVKLAPFVEVHALDDAPAVFEAVAKHAINKRVILKPAARKEKQTGAHA